MPSYDYRCPVCSHIEEVYHSIKKNPKVSCASCMTKMKRMISCGYVITGGIKGSLEDHKEVEHTKKVKDPERAVRSRQKAFGHEAVGEPSMNTDPRHIVRRGRTLSGQQKEINKDDFIKAAAKDKYIVDQCLKTMKSK